MHNHSDEPTEAELWDRIENATGGDRIEAFIDLSMRMYFRSDYSESASLQERLAAIFLEDDNYDQAVIAYARATDGWSEAEEWDNVEEVKERVAQLEEKAFGDEAWRDYYQQYAWAAHRRRASAVALEYIERAILHTSDDGSEENRARLVWQKACIIATFGRSREALALMETALADARSAGAVQLIIDILTEMSQVEVQLLNADRGLALVEEAATLMADTFVWPVLRHRVQFAHGSALIAVGRTSEAISILEPLLSVVPNYPKIRTLIRLSECDSIQSESWEARAYAQAKNTNTWDLLNHLEINRAMQTEPMLAIPVLDSVIARAVEYDDDITRDAARIVLARKYMDLGDFPGAKAALGHMSAANFGDDMLKVITFMVLQADVLIEMGDLVEAQSIATTLTRLDPRREFVPGIAEGFWQLALIEFATNGATHEWERLGNACIARLARTNQPELLAERAEIISGLTNENLTPFERRITTVEEFIDDIRNEVEGFGEDAA